MRETDLKGKTAFIKGASSGIGRACAQQPTVYGVNVITGRRIDWRRSFSSWIKQARSESTIQPLRLDLKASACQWC